MTTRLSLRITVTRDDLGTASELLAARSGLSRGRIKDAMNKGAVWLTAQKGGRKRLRRASTAVRAGDILECWYDEALLARTPPPVRCLYDVTHYSIWEKPAGLLAQGTKYGDHCSLLRQVELFFGGKRPVFPVHRLDREVRGLMLVAHSAAAAGALSLLIRENRIDKGYRVMVRGLPNPQEGRIELPLDQRPARSEYRLVAWDQVTDTATVEVVIETGRLHQIRRHFAMIGHPVIGDPRYGHGNKNADGMRLVADRLLFRCPFERKKVQVVLPEV